MRDRSVISIGLPIIHIRIKKEVPVDLSFGLKNHLLEKLVWICSNRANTSFTAMCEVETSCDQEEGGLGWGSSHQRSWWDCKRCRATHIHASPRGSQRNSRFCNFAAFEKGVKRYWSSSGFASNETFAFPPPTAHRCHSPCWPSTK